MGESSMIEDGKIDSGHLLEWLQSKAGCNLFWVENSNRLFEAEYPLLESFDDKTG